MTNAVYLGDVKHRRFAVKHHAFSYPLYMMWVDLNNIEALNGVHKQLGTTGFKALKFKQSDYLKGLANTDNKPIVFKAGCFVMHTKTHLCRFTFYTNAFKQLFKIRVRSIIKYNKPR